MLIQLLNQLTQAIQNDPISFLGIGLVVMFFFLVVLPLYNVISKGGR